MSESTDHESRTDGPDPVVEVRDLVKRFRRADGSTVNAVDHVSFDVLPGQMVVLVGPSGCGKTTLLRSIAGLERPDSGRITIHGETYYSSERSLDVPPERRRVSMVFQNYALWPHMTAFQNVAYPLKADKRHKIGRKEIAEKVGHILEVVGIGDLAGQHPNQMSGGQRQRVALARALVAGSDLVLFDEPLSNVDAKVRTKLRLELLSMQREIEFSAVFVTHDQIEAMELAHTIAVMGDGRVAQMGTPQEVYETPATRYVANFIGTTNEVLGTIEAVDGDRVTVNTGMGEIVGHAGADATVGDGVACIWRPERTVLGGSPSGPNVWDGTVRASMFVGSHTEYAVDAGGQHFRVWHPDSVLTDEGSTQKVSVEPRHVRVLPADHLDAAQLEGDDSPT
jgi:iron(III) transport system ATP-binding protein